MTLPTPAGDEKRIFESSVKPPYYSRTWILETHAGKGHRTGKVTDAHAEASKLSKLSKLSAAGRTELSDTILGSPRFCMQRLCFPHSPSEQVSPRFADAGPAAGRQVAVPQPWPRQHRRPETRTQAPAALGARHGATLSPESGKSLACGVKSCIYPKPLPSWRPWLGWHKSPW